MVYIVFVALSGFLWSTQPEDKNMHDIERLQRIAQFMYSDTDTRKWLFAHTCTQDEYMQVRRAMKILANFQPVQWEGKPGDRRPVEVRA